MVHVCATRWYVIAEHQLAMKLQYYQYLYVIQIWIAIGIKMWYKLLHFKWNNIGCRIWQLAMKFAILLYLMWILDNKLWEKWIDQFAPFLWQHLFCFCFCFFWWEGEGAGSWREGGLIFIKSWISILIIINFISALQSSTRCTSRYHILPNRRLYPISARPSYFEIKCHWK